jgi:peptide/nickel transport system ATP-binding protein
MNATTAPQPSTTEAVGSLQVDNLSVTHRRTGAELVRSVSLAVAPGEIVGLIGESGSGKTMFCRAIVGALPHGLAISAGSIRLTTPTQKRRGAMSIGMVFADPHASLDPLQKVGHQISEMARVHGALRPRDARKRTLELLQAVAINAPARVYDLYPFEISGGMAQRAMIASVLAANPQFLLADEPTSALDATVQLEILDLLRDLASEQKVGIVLTTHDIAVAGRICNSIGVMYAGRIVEAGRADDVLTRPEHPYTQLLLHARPRGTRAERLAAIPGEPPAPGDITQGCRFVSRCPRAAAICEEIDPALAARAGAATASACHFPGPEPVKQP